MRRDETVCYSCNAPARVNNPKKGLPQYFSLVVNILLIFMVVMTLGSILMSDYFPSFTRCIAVVCILALVKKTADSMAEYRKDG
jgi:uncharacterized membrane protein